MFLNYKKISNNVYLFVYIILFRIIYLKNKCYLFTIINLFCNYLYILILSTLFNAMLHPIAILYMSCIKKLIANH